MPIRFVLVMIITSLRDIITSFVHLFLSHSCAIFDYDLFISPQEVPIRRISAIVAQSGLKEGAHRSPVHIASFPVT